MKRQKRTCQECLYIIYDSLPPEEKTDRKFWKWAERKCPKCKSIAFDFGSAVTVTVTK